MVAAMQRGVRGSLVAESDLKTYRAHQRDALCRPFLAYTVCVMGPTLFGGVVVLQMLQMLEARPSTPDNKMRFSFDDPEFAHYYAEAGRPAQADRLNYVGDPDFTLVPTSALVAGAYVRSRAKSINPARMTKDVTPGSVGVGAKAASLSLELAPLAETADATSQLAVADQDGNAFSMTTTNNPNFGSRLMVGGFVLNNAMTNLPLHQGRARPRRTAWRRASVP